MPVEATRQAYSRDEVRRLVGISERQLRSWEKLDFVPAAESYDFPELLALKTLAGLRANKIPAAQICSALKAIRGRMGDVRDPFTELRIYSNGKRIEVQFAGQKMEPLSGQLLLDFDEIEIKKLLSFPSAPKEEPVRAERQKKRQEAEQWFETGLELEQRGAPLDEVIEAYKRASELDPASAGALVNLGTVYFNLRKFREAESHYRKALEADPKYALAHYNLGNLFDEQGDRSKALGHYQSALAIHPNYADAHYNLALVYQSLGQSLQAVQHWKIYLKLDPSSNWADVARRELGKLRDLTIVRGNRPGG